MSLNCTCFCIATGSSACDSARSAVFRHHCMYFPPSVLCLSALKCKDTFRKWDCWKSLNCHSSRSEREKERGRERGIVYLALLVTVPWLVASSHALDLWKQPRQAAEWQLSHPVRLPQQFCRWNSIGQAETNRWTGASHWPSGNVIIYS